MIRENRNRLTALLLLAGMLLASRVAGAGDSRPPAAVSAPDLADVRFDKVAVESSKTSFYLGSVSLALSICERHEGSYAATYTAKVFPFFFANEKGHFRIDFPDEQLRALARGERVHFKGRAVNTDGQERQIEGHATPGDVRSGKIKVRVRVLGSVELIFNTTYRFLGAGA